MKRRLEKEFRALWLPCAIAAVAAILVPLRRLFDPGEGARENLAGVPGALIWILFEAATFAFVAGLVMLPAMSFGSEFHNRTLPLLLSQPMSRRRIWSEKTLALLLAIGLPAAVYGLGTVWARFLPAHFDWAQRLAPGGIGLAPHGSGLDNPKVWELLFLLGVVCPAVFWTLVARSSTGGTALSSITQFLGALVTMFVLQKIYGDEIPLNDQRLLGTLGLAAAIYFPGILLLGLRKFQRFELRDAVFGETGARPESFPAIRWEPKLLRVGQAMPRRNLIHKEVRLNKPLFLLAAVFVVCWFTTFGLFCFTTAYKQTFETTLAIVTSVYVVIIPWLAGCISQGEEKLLGLSAWHLTLPISARGQWFIKFGTALGLGIGLGIILPWVLGFSYALKIHQVEVYVSPARGTVLPLLSFWSLLFLLSFWSASLVTNVVKAALTGVACLALFASAAIAGFWWADEVGGLETGLLAWLVWHTPLSPATFSPFRSSVWFGVLVEIVFGAVLLFQSFAQFRRAQPGRRALVKCAAILAGMAFAISFWISDWEISSRRLNDVAPMEAIQKVVSTYISSQPADALAMVRMGQIDLKGQLPQSTRKWVDGATFQCEPIGKPVADGKRRFRVILWFANGAMTSFECEGK